MTILSGWKEQYSRMVRSLDRLRSIASGGLSASSDDARDSLFHFYQDAYHLKDWIKNDSSISSTDIEEVINVTEPLQVCADLCNGTKHLDLQRSRSGDSSTVFATQSVIVRPATIGSGLGADPALHGWTVESNGKHYDAVELADVVVAEWESWLVNQGLV